MPDLIATTLDALTIPGMAPGDAARELSAGLQSDLGMTYDATRIGQWRRGERAIPQPVQDWMLRACITHAIGQWGGTAPPDEADLDRLAAMLCPPLRDFLGYSEYLVETVKCAKFSFRINLLN